MSLTIRKISPEAEKTINQVIDRHERINTKTKAIEYVLTDYPTIQTIVKSYSDELFELEKERDALRRELNTIKTNLQTFKMLIDGCAK